MVGEPNEYEFKDITEFARMYRSVVTPANYTFIIRGVALLFQGIFAITQMLPRYCASPMVQEGVGALYFTACLNDSNWLFIFNAEEDAELGLFFLIIGMAITLLFLSLIIVKQGMVNSDDSPEEYWLLRFPFSLMCGWTLVKFLITLNAPFANVDEDGEDSGSSVQIILAAISLGFIMFVAVYTLIFCPVTSPNYVIPAVLSWCTFGMALHLHSEEMDEYFGDDGATTLVTFKVSTYMIAFVLALGTAFVAYKNEDAFKINEIEFQSSYEGESLNTENLDKENLHKPMENLHKPMENLHKCMENPHQSI
eukprot:CAMPEP_0198250826 /NCGR_PEP_ID=MMETSP1447-20131203/1861_1 /TAXON_ID=420782 /ORGANISM="Chaetoceros dichaeta, Strain CCMP1751" /LENGTH=308 /DNA_ID=CAMNT_0043935713 /DNA_START=1 /DNA_END=927 /DNA_ORIENTATION=-